MDNKEIIKLNNFSSDLKEIIGNYYNLDITETLINIDCIKNRISNFHIKKYLKAENSQEKKNNILRNFSLILLMFDNDGSMTKTLSNLVENQENKNFPIKLKLNLLENKIYSKIENFNKENIIDDNLLNFEENYIKIKNNQNFFENFKSLQNKYLFEIESDTVIKRIIEFYYDFPNSNENSTNEKINLMYGISFWDEIKYNKLYESEINKKKPIGVILRESKIELYKEIEMYFCDKDELIFDNKIGKNFLNKNVLIIRISKYYKDNEIFFFLIETFELNTLLNLFENLK